ncbi:MAG: tetratricopeptide repeat protein [Gemmatimonadaceae bacterium]|jgi:tetratricopeptide (TPR) repeat protein
MIRHQVYFDRLGSMREDSPLWRSVFAGLSVLRLIDSYVETGASVDPTNWAQLHSVRSAVDNVSDGDPMRGVLTTVLEEANKRAAVDEVVCASLLQYGHALDYEASWGLAVDVFSTVAKLARPEKNPRLAVEANILVGGSARRNGDWEISARAYSQAAYIADTVGDREGVLTVQVGIANTYMAKGNLPQAQTILDDVIIQAQDRAMADVHGRALHARAALAARQGKHAEGLKLAYEALGHIRKPAQRDEVLDDMGAMFTLLGRYDAARDTHLILANTAQTKLVRWSASLNLMELASLDGQELAFDTYSRELAREPLNPWLRAHYLLFLGEGFARFGRYEAAEDALSEASVFADVNQLHELAFKAQSALEALHATSTSKPKFSTASQWVPEEVDTVIRAISDLRKATVAASD